MKSERRRLSIKQEKLAEHLSITRRTLSTYEAGESTPNAMHLSILQNLGFDILYIIMGTPTSNSSPELEGLDTEEKALLDNYRTTDEEGKKALQRISVALARDIIEAN